MSNIYVGANLAYKSICQGYSEHPFFEGVFVKHFTSFDLACSGDYYDKELARYIKIGAKTQDQILKEKVKEGKWIEGESKKIENLEDNIKMMQDKKSKASIFSQIEEIDSIITDYSTELNALLNKKHSFFTLSAEHLANIAATDYVLTLSLFKDKQLSNPLFSLEEVEHMSESETEKYIKLYHDCIVQLNHKKIREISVNRRFFHFFKNSSSAESFFGKCGKDLTQNQIALFDYSKYFHKLLEEIEDITDDEIEDPDKIEQAFILSRNAPQENQDASLRNAFAKAKTFNIQ